MCKNPSGPPLSVFAIWFMRNWIWTLPIAVWGLVHISVLEIPKKSIQVEQNLSVREFITERRELFFGHREFSDLLSALDILANTVELISLPTTERAQLRFEKSLSDLKLISRYRLGMNEIFLFPANYLLFNKNDASAALSVLDLGVDDPRATPQMPLMAGFIAHVFLRDTKKAAKYYENLSKKPNVPAWVGELSAKLEMGNDPLVTDFRLAKKLCILVKKVFPQSERTLAQTHPECLKGQQQ